MKELLKSLIKKMMPSFLLDIIAQRSILFNAKVGKFVKLNRPYKISNANIGDYSYIGWHSFVSNVEIGKFCSIGPNFFAGWGVHPVDKLSTSPMFYSCAKQNGMTLVAEDKFTERRPIKIGNDVFIGANVTILDGVQIGDGAVIAAGAVVASDVAPYAIVGGVPARLIRERFPADWVTRLREIKWWDFPADRLWIVKQYFDSVEAFLRITDFDKKAVPDEQE